MAAYLKAGVVTNGLSEKELNDRWRRLSDDEQLKLFYASAMNTPDYQKKREDIIGKSFEEVCGPSFWLTQQRLVTSLFEWQF